ncbi:hypothetical protein AUJ65_06340 [Candidatus Micrarchaeota archaeon CG1_02_51_15]|nr:MAG: hypothetical protein AUJ65_06340 [Candidatus Micrarchaeota archaeon CG1_02_51_15]
MLAAKQVEASGKKVLKLNLGDPNAYDFDVPPYVKKALVTALDSGKSGYCDSQGDLALRNAVVKQNSRRGFDSSADEVMVCSGLSEGLSMLYGAAMERHENVLIPSPTYPMYESLAHYYEFEPRFYSCDESNGWQPDVDDLRKKMDEHTRFVIVINPNNPTGALYDEKVLKEIINLAGEFGVPVVSDEIYDELYFGKKPVSMGKLAGDVPCIVMNGLSKNYFAPGWRIGWMTFLNCSQSPLFEAVNQVSRIRLCSSSVGQAAAAHALENEGEYAKFLPAQLAKLKPRRDLAFKRLNEINGLSCVKPEGAFYAFPRIESGPWVDDKEFCLDLLKEKGVLTVFGSGFAEAQGSKHFRIVFLPPEDVLNPAFDAIEEFMKEKGA